MADLDLAGRRGHLEAHRLGVPALMEPEGHGSAGHLRLTVSCVHLHGALPANL